MPTHNRRRFVAQAMRYFLRQNYPNKELVILDDGTESVADLLPDDSQIHYIRLTGQRTLGAKRNECVEPSHGDLIMPPLAVSQHSGRLRHPLCLKTAAEPVRRPPRLHLLRRDDPPEEYSPKPLRPPLWSRWTGDLRAVMG